MYPKQIATNRASKDGISPHTIYDVIIPSGENEKIKKAAEYAAEAARKKFNEVLNGTKKKK